MACMYRLNQRIALLLFLIEITCRSTSASTNISNDDGSDSKTEKSMHPASASEAGKVLWTVDDFCSEINSRTQASCDEIGFERQKHLDCQKDDSDQCFPCGFKKAQLSSQNAFKKIVKDGRCYSRNFKVTSRGHNITIVYHREADYANEGQKPIHTTICDSESNLSDWGPPDINTITASICQGNEDGPLIQKCFTENPLNILKFKNTSGSSKTVLFVMQVQIDQSIQCKNSECILQITNNAGDFFATSCLPLKVSSKKDTTPTHKATKKIAQQMVKISSKPTKATIKISTSASSTHLTKTAASKEPILPKKRAKSSPTSKPLTKFPTKTSKIVSDILSRAERNQSPKDTINESTDALPALKTPQTKFDEQYLVKNLQLISQLEHNLESNGENSMSSTNSMIQQVDGIQSKVGKLLNKTSLDEHLLESSTQSREDQLLNNTSLEDYLLENNTQSKEEQLLKITGLEDHFLDNNTQSKEEQVLDITNLEDNLHENSIQSEGKLLLSKLLSFGKQNHSASNLQEVLILQEEVELTSGKRSVSSDWQIMLMVMLAAQLCRLLL